ncbi:MAG: T9SS type A sorting domain-containing protein [Ignavibacteriaceae bacterium]|nr:T9SS type A sorting domain-containing protein [Ignavibacteriaceae bacterium]
MDIFFVDKNIGWALTLKDVFPFTSVILKTTNGGDEWTADSFPDSSKLIRTIFFFDSLNGFAGGSYIARTSDGGNSWVEADIDSNMVSGFPVYRFNFYNQRFGYACGGRIDVAGVTWRTTNSGLNWSARGISADEVFDIFILDSLNAITLSGDPEGLYPIADLKTTNAGIDWLYEELSFYGLSFRIDFRTYNEGWSASGYKFLLTANRGETWQEFETPDGAVVYDLQFLDARNGFAAGENGVILKLDPALVSVGKELDSPNKFILHQNYPNPFNSKTMIGYDLALGGSVDIKVYDIIGNEITTLVDEFKQAGKYEVEFNASSTIRNLSSGLYFYQLRVRGSEMNSGQAYIQTKKMIYLK